MGNAEVITGLYEAFGRGDVPTVLSAMDPQVRWYEAESNPYEPDGEGWVGHDAIVTNLFARLAGEWEGFTVHPQHFHDAGDVVTVEGRYTAAHLATGKKLDCQFCHIWTVENGKIVKFQQYADTARLREAMGAA